MQELIYTYKKGQGWVLGLPDDYFVGEHNGYRMVLEHRKPQIGERFYYLHGVSEFCEQGRVKLEALFRRLAALREPPHFNSALFSELTGQFRHTYYWDSPFHTHVTLTVTRTT